MGGAAPAQFSIPSPVACSDGPCGELVRVVIDPLAKRVTHLVVVPRHPKGPAKLVPLDLLAGSGRELRLSCTRAAFAVLDDVREVEFVMPRAETGYGRDQAYAWPHYGLGGVRIGGMAAGVLQDAATWERRPRVRSHDRIPLGEVEVRRGERVYAQDGAIGHVEGLVVDPADHHVTHILLQEGHLWGAKEVTIPIGTVTRISDEVHVSMRKEEIAALPPVPIDHP